MKNSYHIYGAIIQQATSNPQQNILLKCGSEEINDFGNKLCMQDSRNRLRTCVLFLKIVFKTMVL